MRVPCVVALLFASALPAAQTEADPPARKRPNILFLYADDHAEAAISACGGELVETPHIDALAAQGLRFTQSFVANSICGPARACVMSGLHSHANGMTTNRTRMPAELPTFPALLSGSGYHTAMVGKWHTGGDPVMFEDWTVIEGRYYRPTFRTAEGREERPGHSTALIADEALRWLAEERDPERPFCLWVCFKAAHRAWEPAPEYVGLFDDVDMPEPATLFDDYAGRSPAAAAAQMRIARDLFPAYDLKLPITGEGILDGAARDMRARMTEEERAVWEAAYGPRNEAFAAAGLDGDALTRWKYQRYVKDYLRCVAGLDAAVGRLSAWLDESGLADDTIVVYSSDQGFFLGEHGWYDKRWIYEPSLRTPLIVRWPGVTAPGSTSDALVQNIDLAPTFLDVAGVEAPEGLHGASLAPLFAGETPERWRDAIYYHYQQRDSGRTTHTVAPHLGLRTASHKLVYVYDHDAWELYDLARDPHEVENRAGDEAYAELQRQLTERLRGLVRRYEDESAPTF